MKSKLISSLELKKDPPTTRLMRYVGEATSPSRGEIVLVLEYGGAVVIHSVHPKYPVGFFYTNFVENSKGPNWIEIAGALVEFRSEGCVEEFE